MASRVRGRSIVAVILIGFVLVAAGVIWRRGYGTTIAIENRELDQRRAQLADEKADLERQIRGLAGREHLQGVAQQRLGMHVPDDSQVVVLPSVPVVKHGTP